MNATDHEEMSKLENLEVRPTDSFDGPGPTDHTRIQSILTDPTTFVSRTAKASIVRRLFFKGRYSSEPQIKSAVLGFILSSRLREVAYCGLWEPGGRIHTP